MVFDEEGRGGREGGCKGRGDHYNAAAAASVAMLRLLAHFAVCCPAGLETAVSCACAAAGTAGCSSDTAAGAA
eukprot:635242-Pelagomonas_calceolata.AAC.1